jgi:hypothetical protein
VNQTAVILFVMLVAESIPRAAVYRRAYRYPTRW